MTTEMIDTKQIEGYFDAANEAAEKSSKMARGAVIEAIESGQQLNNAKESVPHGEWATYLGKHWNYTQKTACQYMLLAANFTCGLNLKDAKSINDALRMIADDKAEKDPDPPIVPRSERKPADVKVSKPTDEPADEPDPDPTPDPPTNRKTAKGSEKVPEAKKPKTAAIVPEIVDEPESDPWEYMTFGDIIAVAVSKLADETQQKKAAKELRKLADKLDPPTKFRRPESDDVLALLRVYAATEEFISKHGKRSDMELAIATEGFMDHYDGNGWLIGKAAMKDWQATARKWLRNQPQFSNGKAQNNGHSNGRTDGSCLGTNGRPEVQKRKIIYK